MVQKFGLPQELIALGCNDCKINVLFHYDWMNVILQMALSCNHYNYNIMSKLPNGIYSSLKSSDCKNGIGMKLL